MKINKPDINTLTVKTSTLFFKLFGMIFLIAGVVMLYFMTDSYTLKCEDRKRQCVLTHHQWLSSQQNLIERVKRAKIVYSKRNGSARNYYLKLKTSEGNIKLNQIGSPSRTELRKNALMINRYIRTPRGGSITIEHLYPWWFTLLPIAFILTSILTIFLPKSTQAIFDKGSNALIIRRKNLFSNSETKHSLSEIKEVVLEETSGKNGRLYRIAFVFKDESIVPLSKSYDNFLPSKIKGVDAMCEFLNLTKDPEIAEQNKNKNKLGLIAFVIALSFILEGMYLVHSGVFS